ncbi:MAG: bifunctional metallophosphatase/5'-nucleotidase [Lentisphaerae bacterium]|nr:bifunctional metallophosphatase/5'-nucleotidase [Lentisphaerota bacterium]MBT4821047.1 bifunctional metallophosphatase/5'-nucleotidase [Lentisphaerota bacterium]MBT5611518.1 bifunctional metallophosphatase/5'-nucleotidase [Lentisphaerota bacterium]MBT7054754.1 bifunctional metallophosphatase/5'-nucleotidase [Lentisphaerota bacterium]MBT7844278.1 bifunctional metallophosphatase/5'-nucleotidase [Lentisphaerota bacterium]
MRRLCLFLAIIGLAVAAGPTITILHTNDLHQAVGRLPGIAGYAAQYKAKHPNTVFIDAGDWFDRGSSLPLVTRGEAIYGAMANMGYDMWILGNHDWAYSGARLRELMAKYPVPVLGSNLASTDHPLPENVLPILLKEIAGIRVGFFGITLDTYGKNPRSRPYIHVLDARESTAEAIRALKARKVDVIVAVTHLGFRRMKHETARTCPTDLDLAQEFPPIDVIVGGHSHSTLKEKQIREIHAETGTIIVQAGASGRYMGRLTLEIDPATRKIAEFDVELVGLDEQKPRHPETAAFLAAQYAAHMPNAKQVVGTLDQALERYNTGYWYAEFLREQTRADIVLLPVTAFYKEPKTFPKGPMTVERLQGYFFDKVLIELRVSGDDLIAYLMRPSVTHRLNPLHDRGRPYSEDAIYYAGLDVAFSEQAKTVLFTLDNGPERTYTVVTPWFHSWRHLLDGEERGLPTRATARKAKPLPGLSRSDQRVLPVTTMQLMIDEAVARGITFQRKYAKPRPDWPVWKAHYEAERQKR